MLTCWQCSVFLEEIRMLSIGGRYFDTHPLSKCAWIITDICSPQGKLNMIKDSLCLSVNLLSRRWWITFWSFYEELRIILLYYFYFNPFEKIFYMLFFYICWKSLFFMFGFKSFVVTIIVLLWFRYFSYEHFYVIYCKFWELDNDHDFLIDKENIIKYGNHALTFRIVDRIFSQVWIFPLGLLIYCLVLL